MRSRRGRIDAVRQQAPREAVRPQKTPLMAAFYGLVPAARYSAHSIDMRGGSPTLTGAPALPPAAAPRPRANRLFGFALELRRNQLQTYERAMREYGDVVRLVVGRPACASS